MLWTYRSGLFVPKSGKWEFGAKIYCTFLHQNVYMYDLVQKISLFMVSITYKALI